MTRRSRLLAALVALVAFTAYFAESALAVLCAPMPDTVAAVVADAGHAGGGHAAGAARGNHAAHRSHSTEAAHADNGVVAGHPHAGVPAGAGDAATRADHDAASGAEEPASGSHESHCPLGMSGPTCTGSTLPASVVTMLPAPAHAESAFAASQVNVEILLARSLYHPPRA
jgi:hypothetical protein